MDDVTIHIGELVPGLPKRDAVAAAIRGRVSAPLDLGSCRRLVAPSLDRCHRCCPHTSRNSRESDRPRAGREPGPASHLGKGQFPGRLTP